ncbi:helix-turn-helix domain-containing protein [Micromonospora profundi]|uniref:helix-turn-helix domain-containing protein n=1 Tax=Micromonospora profundi TaxID=1420889 RepID=UPI001FD7B9BA|nr:helix-turn-helix domain-containing protein [Micromonospora profundi]
MTPRARLRLARLVVDEGWSVAQAARRYDVSWRTAKRWTDRYREQGADGPEAARAAADPLARPGHPRHRSAQPHLVGARRRLTVERTRRRSYRLVGRAACRP